MSQKEMKYSVLFDYYGALLSENQRNVIDLYYNEDFSLSEIADEISITRQGVHDALHRAESALDEFEHQLGLVKIQEKKCAIAEKMMQISASLDPIFEHLPAAQKQDAEICLCRFRELIGELEKL